MALPIAIVDDEWSMTTTGLTPSMTNHANRISKIERVNVSVGADIEAVLRCNQRLEMTKPAKRFAFVYLLATVAAERMKAIVTFGAKDPDDRVGVSVCRGHN